jgi:hypothetical protein
MRALLVFGTALALALGPLVSAAADQWKAGIATIRITPDRPIWLTGFAARTNVSQGTLQELFAMIYYVQPGPFAPSIEETIIRKVHELADRTRKK